MISAVEKGMEFEKNIKGFIEKCGMKATRTSKSNVYDPECYKAGFDGGIDIIAEFVNTQKYQKSVMFYIQCKCHNYPLSKQAICEAYAGMHARQSERNNNCAVVITTAEVSQETRLYAKSLGVELVTRDEYSIVDQARKGMSIGYGNYGIFIKALLYLITKDNAWLDSLPYTKNALSYINTTEDYLKRCKVDFDKAQSYLDSANALERRAEQERQKALDIQKVAVLRSLQRESKSSSLEDG